jgi:hypothetical protein
MTKWIFMLEAQPIYIYIYIRMAEHRKDFKRWKERKRRKKYPHSFYWRNMVLKIVKIVLIENVQSNDEFLNKEACYI